MMTQEKSKPLSRAKIIELQEILKKDYQMYLTYEEAAQVGYWLLTFYEVMISEK